jgi:membrane protein DedA with SNARE-associated domain
MASALCPQASVTLSALIAQFGYPAVFIGCFLEGETVLVLAGFAAHLGYLSLPAVIAIAAVAGFCGDQTFFEVGRRFGPRVFDRWPVLARARPRVERVVARFGAYAAFGLRFLVGMRIAGPIVMGAGRMTRVKFAVPNAAGALVWACLFGAGGYVFGAAFTRTLEHARRYEEWAFAAVAVVGAIVVTVLHLRSRHLPPPAP